MKKKWIVAERKADDVIEHLLLSRGITGRDAFLNPSFDQDRHDPLLLSGMDKAVELLSFAVQDQKPIGIYGDYDCDGIPGTALLYRGLQQLGSHPHIYIPRRLLGYGVSKEGIDALKALGVQLMITIDCGITAVDEIAYAREQGIEVIVTDHHEPHDIVPDAVILNPKLVGSSYPFRELCGTGVVYKLIEGLSHVFPDKISLTWLKWHLDLVALATICDMVELTGENRMFAKYGLTVLRKSRNPGLQALIKVAGVDPTVLSAGTVGFGIGPRINAAGRMDEDPMLGFNLLITEDQTEADEIAQTLQRLNLERQSLVATAVDQSEQLMKSTDQVKAPAIALQHPEWTAGILGLIASKLLERYHRPVFIFEGRVGKQKGSARSIEDFPLPPALEILSDHFEAYGGHALAGGMTLKAGQFDQFKEQVHRHAAEKLGPEERQPHLHIDAEIDLSTINPRLAQQIAGLEPFGIGNPRPLFLLNNVNLSDIKVIGSASKHLRGTIVNDGTRLPFVAFGQADRKEEFPADKPVKLVGRIEENTWNGTTKAELHVVDIDQADT